MTHHCNAERGRERDHASTHTRVLETLGHCVARFSSCPGACVCMCSCMYKTKVRRCVRKHPIFPINLQSQKKYKTPELSELGRPALGSSKEYWQARIGNSPPTNQLTDWVGSKVIVTVTLVIPDSSSFFLSEKGRERERRARLREKTAIRVQFHLLRSSNLIAECLFVCFSRKRRGRREIKAKQTHRSIRIRIELVVRKEGESAHRTNQKGKTEPYTVWSFPPCPLPCFESMCVLWFDAY